MVSVLCAWLLADLMAGLVHWAQDKLLIRPTRFAFLNAIKADNDFHHAKPFAMLKFSVWENIKMSALFAWPLSLALWFVGAPLIIWLAVFFSSFGNYIHRLSHTPKRELNWFVKFMQWTDLFISYEDHARHHFDAKGLVEKQNSSIRYCPMSNWLNPFLDYIKFFSLLERLVKRESA